MNGRDARALIALVSIVCLCGLSGCASHSGGGSSASCASVLSTLAPVTEKGERAAGGASVEVDAANAAFAPTCVTGVPRGTFTLTVHNTGLVIHDVAIPAQHIDVDISPRKTATIRVQIGETPVVYTCRYHRALGMVGVLIPAPSG